MTRRTALARFGRALACWLTAGALRLAAAEIWEPVDPALLAETAPRIDPDAPAEAVFRKITIDDRGFPKERRLLEYVRYKIFDPEKATAITRISGIEATVNGERRSAKFELRARLTLPNGGIREFGEESLQQRALVSIGSEQSWIQRLVGVENTEVNEKFLAISGIEPGAVLDLRTSRRAESNSGRGLGPINQLLQLAIPTRRLDFMHRLPDRQIYALLPFLLNARANAAHLASDKNQETTFVMARNLAGLAQERFVLASADYALTYLCSYVPRRANLMLRHSGGETVHIDPAAGPWAGFATTAYMIENDILQSSPRLGALARRLTDQTASETEKARRIHRFVQDFHRAFLLASRGRPSTAARPKEIDSIEQVLDYAEHPDWQIRSSEFVWLALALYRSAGLEAQTVLLPDRGFTEFSREMVAEMFLPARAVRVRVDGNWQYSSQEEAARLPFGMLPWQSTGEGLVAQSNKQEFVEAPLTPAEQSVTTNRGKFRLGADGALSGECRRTFIGQPAFVMRTRLRLADASRQRAFFGRLLAQEFRTSVGVMEVTGADDPDLPLTVTFQLTLPDYATLTKQRMIFRPSLFHASSPALSSARRRYPVRFPFPWKEADHVEIQFPSDYAMESKWAPASLPGDVLSYRCELSLAPRRTVLTLNRESICKATAIPVEFYPRFKAWYDRVAESDGHDLVLRKSADPGPASQPPPAGPAAAGGSKAAP